MFPITQQQACGRPGSSHQPEDNTWLGQQNTGKSKMLLFHCLVWQTLIARKLVFLRRVSAHKGVPGLAKGCEATVIAWEWKGSFRNSDCQHGPPIYRVMQAAAELALRPLLPIFCPAPLPPVAGRPCVVL